jgi:hypothetical protein
VGSDCDSSKNNKRNLRGNYRKYDAEIKSTAIKLVDESNGDIKKVSEITNVPIKNIKRWL